MFICLSSISRLFFYFNFNSRIYLWSLFIFVELIKLFHYYLLLNFPTVLHLIILIILNNVNEDYHRVSSNEMEHAIYLSIFQLFSNFLLQPYSGFNTYFKSSLSIISLSSFQLNQLFNLTILLLFCVWFQRKCFLFILLSIDKLFQ
ncbi:unnamed protein product, partial [Rotaria socialis]